MNTSANARAHGESSRSADSRSLWPDTTSKKVKRRLYTLLGGVALAAILIGVVGVLQSLRGGDILAAARAALWTCSFGLILFFAYRRSAAAERVGEARTAQTREANVAHWMRTDATGRELRARMPLRRALPAWGVLIALFGFGGYAAAQGGQAWLAAGVLLLAFGGLYLFLRQLAMGDLLIISAHGIEDRRRYGVVPWSEIRSASLAFNKHGLSTLPFLSIRVRDATTFRRRGPRLFRPSDRWEPNVLDYLQIPLKWLDEPPERIFAAARRFNEQVVPRGTLFASGMDYWIDRDLGRMNAVSERILELGKATRREFEELEAKGPVDESSPAYKAWEKRANERLEQLELLSDEFRRASESSRPELERDAVAIAAHSKRLARRLVVFAVVFAVILIVGVVLRR